MGTKEIQIKTTMKYDFIPVSLAFLSMTTNFGEVVKATFTCY